MGYANVCRWLEVRGEAPSEVGRIEMSAIFLWFSQPVPPGNKEVRQKTFMIKVTKQAMYV